MSFQIKCPNCGQRPVWEFHYGGPVQARPATSADQRAWTAYIYDKPNIRGVQIEWWHHRSACKQWFMAERDTRSNQVVTTRPFEPQPQEKSGV